MKNILILLILISASVFAQRGVFQKLKQCEVMCTPECAAFINRLENSLDNIGNCDSTNTRQDIIKTCRSNFITSSNQLECIDYARNIESVEACCDKFVTSKDKLTCINYARNREIVNMCFRYFVTSKDRFECIRRTRNAEDVAFCSVEYVTTSDKLNCLGR